MSKIRPMKYAKVIHDSWNLTVENKRLVWFAFVPCFVGVLVFMAELIWQYFLLSEAMGRTQDGLFFKKLGHGLSILADSGLMGWVIFAVVFVLLFAFVFPSWVQATLILGIRQKFLDPAKRLSLRQKLAEGSSYFFRLFEFHAALTLFKPMTILLFALTMYRYYHGEVFQFLLPIIICFGGIALIINLFLCYVPYFIVCENTEFSSAVKRSIWLVFLHFGPTLRLVLLMVLVELRVIVNVLVIIGVPLGLVSAASYFAASDWRIVVMILAAILGLVLLALAAYLTSILDVFSTGFWERAFTILRAEQKQLEQPTEPVVPSAPQPEKKEEPVVVPHQPAPIPPQPAPTVVASKPVSAISTSPAIEKKEPSAVASINPFETPAAPK